MITLEGKHGMDQGYSYSLNYHNCEIWSYWGVDDLFWDTTAFGCVNYVCPKVSDEPKTSIFRTETLHRRTQRNVL
jgi:hypothetical protein